MDTGILTNFKSPYTFRPEDRLIPEELCWIMDNMTALEVKLYSRIPHGTLLTQFVGLDIMVSRSNTLPVCLHLSLLSQLAFDRSVIRDKTVNAGRPAFISDITDLPVTLL